MGGLAIVRSMLVKPRNVRVAARLAVCVFVGEDLAGPEVPKVIFVPAPGSPDAEETHQLPGIWHGWLRRFRLQERVLISD